MKTLRVRIGKDLYIGGGSPIVVQTMCNTHTSDVDGTVAQCLELSAAGAQMVRITVPGLQDVPHVKEIKERLASAGCDVPIVADIHFSSDTAIAVAPFVEKVRINPGNFHKDHDKAREEFARLLEVCRRHGTAIRVGLNHGSLGKYITDRYGNTPHAMAVAAMEWLQMCIDAKFLDVVVSLKASNTVVMVEAYRELAAMMKANGTVFPMHLGVTEAGGGDTGRIKSCVGIAALLREGIGDTIRVSLTESPVNELPVAEYLAKGKKGDRMLDDAIEWGPKLLFHEIDDMPESPWKDDIMQAARRKFSKPEYIACPGCGRTMYDLQKTFEEVRARTSHLKGMVIAVMGCIVNGPGEMADADWGYVGEGGGKVSIYRKGEPVLRHVPDKEAIDRLLELIENDR
ncbi:MAG: (E)-4-hydroxy-3-methylbut-2-enyl-diphosphate synthase [Bacteroidales bacterium]|nr:(E)-4-hydroxy-3-methylbut-2-enyl-diphosphate synthase [Bacteroidales bacterium]